MKNERENYQKLLGKIKEKLFSNLDLTNATALFRKTLSLVLSFAIIVTLIPQRVIYAEDVIPQTTQEQETVLANEEESPVEEQVQEDEPIVEETQEEPVQEEETNQEVIIEEQVEEEIKQEEEPQVQETNEEPVQEEEIVVEEELVSFYAEKDIDDVRITVSADKGVFPKGATLSAKKVEIQKVEDSIDKLRDDEKKVAVSYTYDIKVVDENNNELEPNGEVSVKFSLIEKVNDVLDVDVYHTDDNNVTEVLETVVEENNENNDLNTDVEVVTESFSYYTVEFTYNTLEYVLQGDEKVALSTILEAVNLTGDVTNATSSNTNLFEVTKENNVYYVTAKKAFKTNETLTVTIGDVDYQIEVTDTQYVAQIGSNNYETLQAAFDVANNSETAVTVKLLSDITLTNSNGVTINSGKDITVDLAGNDITANLNNVDSNGNAVACAVFNIKNNSKLTMIDSVDTDNDYKDCGKIILDSTIHGSWPSPNKATNVFTNEGTLIINGGYYENKGQGYCSYVVDNNSTTGDVSLTVNGGKLVAQYCPVRTFLNNSYTTNKVELIDGIFGGKYIAYIQQPSPDTSSPVDFEVKGGIYNCYKTYSDPGEAFYIDVLNTAKIDFSISGGKFSNTDSTKDFVYLDVAKGITPNADVEISGGVYSSDAINLDYFVNGGCLVSNTNEETNTEYPYTVEINTNVASIGGDYYETLNEAIASISGNNETTITILKDVDNAVGISIPSNRNITIDFGGHTYSISKPGEGSNGTKTNGFQLNENSTIVFKNGTINCTEANKSYTWDTSDANATKGIAIIIQNYADLTLDHMTIDGTNIAHNGNNVRYIVSNNSGDVTIKDSTIIAVGNDFALDSCKYGNYTKPTININSSSVSGKIELTGGDVNLNAGTVVNGMIRVGENKEGTSVKDSVLNINSGATVNVQSSFIGVFGKNTLSVSGTVNGYIATNGNAYNAGSIININEGADINGDEVAIYMPNGTLNITGGSITGDTAVYFKSTNINISGGSLSGTGAKGTYKYDGNGCNATGDALVIDSCNYPNGIDDVSITGGTFTSTNGKAVAAFTSQSGTPITKFISGGSFTGAEAVDSELIAEDYELVQSGNTYTVKHIDVAQIGDTKYTSLDEAFANVSESGTIELLADITLIDKCYKLDRDVSFTLDGNNHTITATNSTSGKWLLNFEPVNKNYNVNIKDITINATGYRYAVIYNSDDNGNYTVNGTLDNVTINAEGVALGVSGNDYGDSDVIVNNCHMSDIGPIGNYSSFIYNALAPQYDGKITVNGGSYSGTNYCAYIYTTGGTLIINDGTFEADTVLMSSISNPYSTVHKKAEIIVNGGTFKGALGTSVGNDKENNGATISISGGTFDRDVNEYCASSYMAKLNNETGKYEVVNAVASVSGTKYESLSAAIDASESGQTITILSDCATGSSYTEDSPLVIAKDNITLDLNGKTITETNNFSFVVAGNNVTVKNGSINSGSNSEKACGYNSYALIIANLKENTISDGIVVDGVTFKGGISVGGDAGTAIKGGANVTLKNCTVTAGDFYSAYSQIGSSITIESGTYSAGGKYGKISLNSETQGTISVTGGTFGTDPSAYCASSYMAKYDSETGKYGITNAVASISGTKYETLQDAIAAVSESGTIALLKDIDGDAVIFNKDINATLDLNGYTFKAVSNGNATSHRNILVTNGTLTIQNGTLDARGDYDASSTANHGEEDSNIYGTIRADGGKVILKNLTLYNNHNYGMNIKICTNASAEVRNCTVYSTTGGGLEAAGGTIDVYDSTFNQTGENKYYGYIATGLAASYHGTVNIYNSTFTTDAEYAIYAFSTGCTINVYSGNFNGNKAAIQLSSNGGENDIAYVNVYGGTFTGSLNDTNNSKCHLVISGGTFNVDPSKYVADGYDAFAQGTDSQTWKVEEEDVASVSATNYKTLKNAIDEATSGQTIKLLANIDLTSQVEIADKEITIDLNGKTIDYIGTNTIGNGLLVVHNGAGLTIDDSSANKDGVIDSGEKCYAAIAVTKNGDDSTNPAKLTVNAGNIKGYYYAIVGNGDRKNTEITINGGSLTGTNPEDSHAIFHPQNGKLAIAGGSLSGYNTAIEIRAGELNISGGTFTASASEYSCVANGSGSTTTGAAIAIAQHTTKQDIKVTISGGTFNGVKAISEANPQGNDPAPKVTMSISGGTFNGKIIVVDGDINNGSGFISGGTFYANPSDYAADGYDAFKQGTTPETWKVELRDVASVSGTNYKTLKEAIDKATSGQTVTLLENIELDSTLINTNQNVITLDLNGKEITNVSNLNGNYLIQNKGNLTITSSVSGAKITDTRSNVQGTITGIDNEGTLTFNSNNVTVSRGSGIALKNEETGTISISAGVFTTASGHQAVQNWNVLNITGGTFNGNISTWSSRWSNTDYAGTTTIDNATVNGDICAFQSKYGGVWSSEKSANVNLGSNITLSGSIKKQFNELDQPSIQVVDPGNVLDSLVTSSSSGYQTTDDAVWYKSSTDNSKYILSNRSVRINDNFYSSLSSAVEAANVGDTVEVLKDIDTNIGAITIDKSITIDGNNHHVVGGNDDENKRGTDSSQLNYSGFVIAGDDVTIKNLHVSKMGNYAAIKSTGKNTIIDNVKLDYITRMAIDIDGGSASGTINNCYVDMQEMYSSTGNGIQVEYGATVTITNTTVINVLDRPSNWASSGICVWDDSTVIVDNCTLDNCTYAFGVENYGAKDKLNLTISNTEVKNCDYGFESGNEYDTNNFDLTLNSGNDFAVKYNIGNYYTVSGSNVSLSGKITINDGTYTASSGQNALFAFKDSSSGWNGYLKGNIEVTGGTIYGPIAKAYVSGTEVTLPDDIAISVSGGTFSEKVNYNYLADGYVCVASGTNYIVEEGTYVAEMNDERYQYIQNAITNSTSGTETTIKLLADTDETVTVYDGKNIVLDTNGKTLTTSSASGSTITNYGTLSISGSGTIKRNDASGSGYVIDNRGTLNIDEVTIAAADSSTDAKLSKALIINGSDNKTSVSMNINGGTIGQTYFNAIINNADLTINGGTIYSDSTYTILNNGELNINGGTVSGPIRTRVNDNFVGNTSISGGSLNNVTFYVEKDSSYSGTNYATLTIDGGEYTYCDYKIGTITNNVTFTENSTNATITITGGYYASCSGVATYTASNKEYLTNTGDNSTSFPNWVSDRVNGTKVTVTGSQSGVIYDTFENAIEAASESSSGATVTAEDKTSNSGLSASIDDSITIVTIQKEIAANDNNITADAGYKINVESSTSGQGNETIVTNTYTATALDIGEDQNNNKNAGQGTYIYNKEETKADTSYSGSTVYPTLPTLKDLNTHEQLTQIAESNKDTIIQELHINQGTVAKALNDAKIATVTNSGSGTNETKAMDVSVYFKAYFETKIVNDIAGESGRQYYTIDIKPMYQTYATTASGTANVTKANSVEIEEPKELNVTGKTVTMSIQLPEGFVSSTEDKVYVNHTTANGIKTYNTTVTYVDNKYYASFDNPDGYSEFEITRINLEGNNKVSLTLNGEIGINFYIDVEGYVGSSSVSGVTATINYNEGINYNENFVDKQITTLEKSISGSTSGLYKFTVNVAPWKIGDDVKITIQKTVDSTTTKLYEKTYSPKQYCLDVKSDSNSDEDLVNLCDALLKYGASAQMYFGYKKNNLVTSSYDCMDLVPDGNLYKTAKTFMKDDEKAASKDLFDETVYNGGKYAGISYINIGNSAVCEENLKIRNYLTPSNENKSKWTDGVTYSIEIDSELDGNSAINAYIGKNNNGKYYIEVEIPYAQLSNKFKVILTNNSLDEKKILSWQMEPYQMINMALNDSSINATEKNLFASIYNYSEMANAFFNAN